MRDSLGAKRANCALSATWRRQMSPTSPGGDEVLDLLPLLDQANERREAVICFT